MNQEAPVLYERVGRLALITFNRPEKLNAINGDMQRLLREGLTEAKSDDSVRVVILRGRDEPSVLGPIWEEAVRQEPLNRGRHRALHERNAALPANGKAISMGC